VKSQKRKQEKKKKVNKDHSGVARHDCVFLTDEKWKHHIREVLQLTVNQVFHLLLEQLAIGCR